MSDNNTKLLNKTWFGYTLAFYIVMALAVHHFALPQCEANPSFNATQPITRSRGAFTATYVFASITAFFILVWMTMRYVIARKQSENSEALLESFLGPSDRQGATSAEELLAMITATFFSCLMRLCVFIGFATFLSVGCATSETVTFLVFALLETLITIMMIYYAARSDDDTFFEPPQDSSQDSQTSIV